MLWYGTRAYNESLEQVRGFLKAYNEGMQWGRVRSEESRRVGQFRKWKGKREGRGKGKAQSERRKRRE